MDGFFPRFSDLRTTTKAHEMDPSTKRRSPARSRRSIPRCHRVLPLRRSEWVHDVASDANEHVQWSGNGGRSWESNFRRGRISNGIGKGSMDATKIEGGRSRRCLVSSSSISTEGCPVHVDLGSTCGTSREAVDGVHAGEGEEVVEPTRDEMAMELTSTRDTPTSCTRGRSRNRPSPTRLDRKRKREASRFERWSGWTHRLPPDPSNLHVRFRIDRASSTRSEDLAFQEPLAR